MYVIDPGEKRLFIEIFRRAVLDVLGYPFIRDNSTKYYKVDSNPAYALDAKSFLRLENKAFRIYCEYLGLDPEYAYMALAKKINYWSYAKRRPVFNDNFFDDVKNKEC